MLFRSLPQTTVRAQQRVDDQVMKGLKWRSIGPYRGGRSTAVAGVTSQPNVFYFGATGGGVWKSLDGGTNWENVSDTYFKTGSVGAIGISESSTRCWARAVVCGIARERAKASAQTSAALRRARWLFIALAPCWLMVRNDSY